MANARLLYSNDAWRTATTISASAAATGYPASNLSSSKRTKIWRSSTTTGDQSVVVDFNGSRTITQISIANYLIHVGGSVKAEYWNGAAYVTFGTYTIPSTNRTRLLTVYGSQSTTKIRIYFTNTGGVSQAVELGIVYAGAYLEPTQNVAIGVAISPVDPSIVRATLGGQEQVWERTGYQIASFTYGPISSTDRDALQLAFDTVGRRTPVVFALDSSNVDQTLYGTLPSSVRFAHVAGSLNYWSVSFEQKEAL